MIETPHGIATGPIYQREKPVRDPLYLRFIRMLPCVVCLKTYGIEAAHTGPHGIGQKSSDRSCLPLCRVHHRTGNDSLHKLGPVRFAEAHGLDIPALIKRFNQFFDSKFRRVA